MPSALKLDLIRPVDRDTPGNSTPKPGGCLFVIRRHELRLHPRVTPHRPGDADPDGTRPPWVRKHHLDQAQTLAPRRVVTWLERDPQHRRPAPCLPDRSLSIMHVHLWWQPHTETARNDEHPAAVQRILLVDASSIANRSPPRVSVTFLTPTRQSLMTWLNRLVGCCVSSSGGATPELRLHHAQSRWTRESALRRTDLALGRSREHWLHRHRSLACDGPGTWPRCSQHPLVDNVHPVEELIEG